MNTRKINNHIVNYYDSIEDMSSSRYFAFNDMCIVDAGIGSDLESVDRHIDKISEFIKHEKGAEATHRLLHMKQNIYFVAKRLSPEFMSFAALVHSIDGKEYNDMTTTGLKRVVKDLEKVGFTVGMYRKVLNAVKKKSNMSSSYISRNGSIVLS